MSNRELSNELCEKAFDLSVDDDYKGALEHYNKAIEADSTNPKAYIERAKIYQDMAEDENAFIAAHKKSISDYTLALQHITDAKEKSEVLADRATSYAITGETDKQIADCSEAIKLDAENQYAYYWRAAGLWDKERYQEAFPDYQKAADLGNETAVNVLKEKYNWTHGKSYADNIKDKFFGKRQESGSDDSGTQDSGPKAPLLVKLAGAVVGGALLALVVFPFTLIIGAVGGWFLSGFIWKIWKSKTNK